MIVKPEGLEFFGVVLRSAAIRTNSRTAAGAVETNSMEATTVTSAFLVLREKQSLSLRRRKIINAAFKTEIVPKVKQTPHPSAFNTQSQRDCELPWVNVHRDPQP